MTSLVERIVTLHLALEAAAVPHAFGGALALAWCTERARGTIDIDVNVFVPHEAAAEVLAVLPAGVAVSATNREQLARDGQTRLWWDTTPVDVFFNTTEFHVAAARRARRQQFAGADVPFLSCRDLAVFKAFFNRTKDWADLEEMAAVGALDLDAVLGTLVRYLGGTDERVSRLRALSP